MAVEPIVAPKPIYVVSDGTGETAEKVVRAGLRQFSGHLVHVRVFPDITRTEGLAAVYRHAHRSQGLVVTTLVRREMRETAERLAIEYQVQTHDLFGPLLASFGGFLDQVPVGVPGILHRADAFYYKRIEAVEFTVRADDGKDPRLLSDADVVLVGVSRTSKTPLSTFLAHKGLKVSNQPIVLNRPLPDQLFEIDQGRIFALTIDANALQNIRQERLETMRMPKGTNYGDMAYILAELEFAYDLFRGNPTWPVLDVTNRAIEETAAHIARRLRDRGYMAPLGGDFPI